MTNTATTAKTIEIAISAPGKTFTEVVRLVKWAGGRFDAGRKVWTVTYDPTGLHPKAVEREGEAMAAMDVTTAGRIGFYSQYMTITEVDA